MTYEVIGNATGLTIGQRVSEQELKDGPVSFDKLLRNGAIKPAGPADDENAKLREENFNSGSPEPLRKDMDRDEAIALNVSGGAPDSAAKANPAKGGPGTIKAAKKPE